MTRMRLVFHFAWTVGAVLGFVVDTARADFTINVSWNSSSLVANPANGP